jgi:hypothetical protein
VTEAPFGHESSAIAVRRILQVGVLLGLLVIAVVVIVSSVLRERLSPAREERSIIATVLPPPGVPRLQTHSTHDLQALRTQKDAVLHGWGWTETHDYAHIPIERAMALYVKQHAAEAASPSRRERAPPPSGSHP